MAKGAKHSLASQAVAFETVANVYAPLWRQVNAMKLASMSFEEVDESEWAEPRTDVYATLDYYFENLNQGRPYFLAGHSQGSRLCYMVLSEYMQEHPDRYANMIAAYCLGDSLTKDYLEKYPHVQAAQTTDATLDLERGTVVVTEPRLAKYAMTAKPWFGPASYHANDYSFFLLNIRENARLRTQAWFERASA